MPIRVQLTEGEIAVARIIASMRNEFDRDNGVKSQKIALHRSDEEISLSGMGAEMAFARVANLCPDFDTEGADHACDFTTHRGYTLDVKCTPRARGSLVVKQSKIYKPCDYYILVTGEIPTYKIVGYVSKEELFQPENLQDLGHGPCYVFPRAQVHLLTPKTISQFSGKSN